MAKTSKEIRSEIKVWSTDRDTLRDRAHNILVDILLHSAPKGLHIDSAGSGDTTLALAMLKEMPKSWAEQARVWLEMFTPIRVVTTRDTSGMAQKYKNLGQEGSKDYIADKAEREAARAIWWKLDDAIATPFFKAVDEPEVKLYKADYFDGLIDAQIKTIQKKLDEGKVDPNAILAANATIARLKAAKAVVLAAPAEDAANDQQKNDAANEMANQAA